MVYYKILDTFNHANSIKFQYNIIVVKFKFYIYH